MQSTPTVYHLASRRLPSAVYWRRRIIALLIPITLIFGWQAIMDAKQAPASQKSCTETIGASGFWPLVRKHHPNGEIRPIVDDLARQYPNPQQGQRVQIPC